MELIADALLIAGALGAALYCRTLSRRLGALKDLDSGLGAAIAALSRQVDEMRASLDSAKSVSGDQTREVAQLTARAEMAAGRLELLLASLHEGDQRRPVGAQAAGARPRRSAGTPQPAPVTADEVTFGDDDEAILAALANTLARRKDTQDQPRTPPRPRVFDTDFDDDDARESALPGRAARRVRGNEP